MKIIFVRHGLSTANEKRVLSGKMDVSLSEEGIKKLHTIKKTITYPKTDYYVTSTLRRTVETFNILFEGESVNKTEERFSEIDFGGYEQRSYDDLDLDNYFSRVYLGESISNNELYSDFCDRIRDGLVDLIFELKEKGFSSATVVSHSTVIRSLILKATTDDLETFQVTRPKNGCGYVFELDVVDGELIFSGFEVLE